MAAAVRSDRSRRMGKQATGNRSREASVSVYERLGVRPIINADARLTRLGGSRMPERVLAAMREAAASYVDMHQLQAAVGQRIAALTRNEAAYVTTGAAAGLVLAALAAINEGDLRTIARMLEGEVPAKRRVVVQRRQRIPYDVVMRLAGAEFVEIGNALQTFAWELEAAIDDETAMVLYVAGDHLAGGALGLEEVVAIARPRSVPVVVDAAAQLPPPDNLWRFTSELGADAAIFSGGKDLRGPQASGLIVGKAPFLAAVAVNGSPHQRLGRPMKVGKEEMVGLLAAVEGYLERDHAAALAALEAMVAMWIERFSRRPGVCAEREFPDEAGQPAPRLRLTFDRERVGLDGVTMQRRLWEGEPAIAVAASPHGISLSFGTLDGDDSDVIARRIEQILDAGENA